MFCAKPSVSELQERIATVGNVVGMNLHRIHRVECDIISLQKSVTALLLTQKDPPQEGSTAGAQSQTAHTAQEARVDRRNFVCAGAAASQPQRARSFACSEAQVCRLSRRYIGVATPEPSNLGHG